MPRMRSQKLLLFNKCRLINTIIFFSQHQCNCLQNLVHMQQMKQCAIMVTFNEILSKSIAKLYSIPNSTTVRQKDTVRINQKAKRERIRKTIFRFKSEKLASSRYSTVLTQIKSFVSDNANKITFKGVVRTQM